MSVLTKSELTELAFGWWEKSCKLSYSYPDTLEHVWP